MGKDVQEEKDDNKGSKYNTLCDDGVGSILDTYVHTFGIIIKFIYFSCVCFYINKITA